MDLENEIVLENRLVCFIDILGFADIIEKFEETKDISVIKKIKVAFEDSIKRIQDPISPKSAEILNVSEEKINLLKRDIFLRLSPIILLFHLLSIMTIFLLVYN